MQLGANDFHLVFNGRSQLLKMFDHAGNLRHSWSARDAGINDETTIASADEYGRYCKAPPGVGYTFGSPQACGPDSPDGQAYGWWFIPINDDPASDFAKHGRAGIGIHGGGSASPDPFDPHQTALYDTLGCIRMWNADLGMQTPAEGTLVYAVQYVLSKGGICSLDICWP
jgi:hypothetical protein